MSASVAAAGAVRGRRRARSRRRLTVLLGRLVLLVAILGVWQLLSATHLVDPNVATSPGAIWHKLATWTLDGTLWFHSAITVEETLLGFAAGSVAGIVLGFAIGRFAALAELLDPFIVAIYSVPKVALAPLFIVWFGIGMPMKAILAAVTVLFIVFFNTLAGVRNVDPDLIDAVWLMGARPNDILLKVVVPSALGWR